MVNIMDPRGVMMEHYDMTPVFFRAVRSALLLPVLFLAHVFPAHAADDLARLRSNKCLACHQVDVRRVGPPFVAIADRYAQADGAEAYLADVIRSGSRGKWGAIPMPAQPHVSAADAQLMAAWILALGQPKQEE